MSDIVCNHGPAPHPWEPDGFCPPEPTAADQPTAFTEWCSQPDDHCLNGTCHYGDHGPLTADAEDALRGGGYGSYIDEAEEVDAADQPTTEPSECGAPNPGGGAGGPCLRRPGHGGIHFNTVRGWPLAPAPQPAADTEGVRHFAPWGSYRASCGVAVPPGDAPDSSGFTYRRDDTTCPDCRSHFTNPADTDTEPDERLREARALVSVLRRYPGDRQTPAVRALLALEEEATRLDAVVTAVRDLHKPVPYSSPRQRAMAPWVPENVCSHCLADNDGCVAYPCPTVRALDGGAA